MAIERMTARKVRITDLVNGKWIRREGLEPSFILTEHGNKVSRARVLGTVVGLFLAEDGNFGSLTVDDSTDTIRAKTFSTTKPVDSFAVGDVVDLIGKVREYNGEVYIIPEIITKTQDPNLELLRRLEVTREIKRLKSSPREEVAEIPEKKEEGADEGELKKEILDIITSDPEGVDFSLIMEKIKAPDNAVETAINTLLEEGICYEPVPGKIKKI
jgi:RPA family protein